MPRHGIQYKITNVFSQKPFVTGHIATINQRYGLDGYEVDEQGEPIEGSSNNLMHLCTKKKKSFWWQRETGRRYHFEFISSKEASQIRLEYIVLDLVTEKEIHCNGYGALIDTLGVARATVNKYFNSTIIRPIADRFLVKVDGDERTWDDLFGVKAAMEQHRLAKTAHEIIKTESAPLKEVRAEPVQRNSVDDLMNPPPTKSTTTRRPRFG